MYYYDCFFKRREIARFAVGLLSGILTTFVVVYLNFALWRLLQRVRTLKSCLSKGSDRDQLNIYPSYEDGE